MVVASMRWHLVTSRNIVRDRWLTVRADHCRLPDGREIDPYYVLEYPDWVNIVALTTAEEIVLVRQYRHGLGDTGIELPAGIVEPNDATPESAVRRELLEETGYGFEVARLTGVLSANPATHSNRTHCFLATGCEKRSVPELDATESLETLLVPVGELAALTRTGAMVQSLHVASIFFALWELDRIRAR